MSETIKRVAVALICQDCEAVSEARPTDAEARIVATQQGWRPAKKLYNWRCPRCDREQR